MSVKVDRYRQLSYSFKGEVYNTSDVTTSHHSLNLARCFFLFYFGYFLVVCLDFDILCSWDELSNAFSWIHASYIHMHKNSLYVTIYMRHIHVKQSIHFIFLKKFLTMYLKSLELECWAHFMLVLGWNFYACNLSYKWRCTFNGK